MAMNGLSFHPTNLIIFPTDFSAIAGSQCNSYRHFIDVIRFRR